MNYMKAGKKAVNLMFAIVFVLSIIQSINATVIIDAGSQGTIIDNQTTENQTVVNDTKVFEERVNEKDLMNYVGNMTERMVQFDQKSVKLIESLENESKFYKDLYHQEYEKRNEIEGNYESFKERVQSEIANYEIKLTKQRWFYFIVVAFCVMITVFIMEYINAITRKKKLFFKLRQYREQFPINPGMILGGRKE